MNSLIKYKIYLYNEFFNKDYSLTLDLDIYFIVISLSKQNHSFVINM